MSLDKIAKLLRQAERAATPGEAEAFFAKAQELATREAIDLAIARRHTASKEAVSKPTYENIEIGNPRMKGLRTYCQLFMAIGEANNLRFTIRLNSTAVTAYGFPEDIAVTREIYNAVLPQMVKESDAYVRSDERKAQRVEDPNDWFAPAKPLHGATARLNFQQAYANRIGRRLREAKTAATKDVLHELVYDGRISTALAIRNYESEVNDYYGKATRHIKRSWKGNRSGATVSPHSRDAGRRAADKARLATERGIAAAPHSRGAL